MRCYNCQNSEMFNFEKATSRLRWITFNARRKVCVSCKTDTDYVGITVYRHRSNMYNKDSDIELKATGYNTLLPKKKYLLSYLKTFSKNFFVVEEATHHNWHYFGGSWASFLLLLLFNLTRNWKFVPHSKKTQWGEFPLSVWHCLDPKFSLHEMNDLYPHGGLIGYGDSYLDSMLRYSKVFRVHAILHNAAGAVYAEKKKGSGYCQTIGRGPNSCLFGHVTRLLFVFF